MINCVPQQNHGHKKSMWQIVMIRTYSAVKIMTQAVSRQKNEILYLSPQANTWKFAIYNIGFYFEFEESERKNFNWPHFYQGSLHRAPFQPRWPSPRRQWRSQSRSKTPFEWFFASFLLICLVFLFYRFDLIMWIPGRGLTCAGSQRRATCALAMFPR